MFNGYWKHAAVGLTEEPEGREPEVSGARPAGAPPHRVALSVPASRGFRGTPLGARQPPPLFPGWGGFHLPWTYRLAKGFPLVGVRGVGQSIVSAVFAPPPPPHLPGRGRQVHGPQAGRGLLEHLAHAAGGGAVPRPRRRAAQAGAGGGGAGGQAGSVGSTEASAGTCCPPHCWLGFCHRAPRRSRAKHAQSQCAENSAARAHGMAGAKGSKRHGAPVPAHTPARALHRRLPRPPRRADCPRPRRPASARAASSRPRPRWASSWRTASAPPASPSTS